MKLNKIFYLPKCFITSLNFILEEEIEQPESVWINPQENLLFNNEMPLEPSCEVQARVNAAEEAKKYILKHSQHPQGADIGA